MRGVVFFLFFLFFLARAVGVGGGETATGQVPLCPSDGIYDVAEWLEEASRLEMVRSIRAARETGGAALFVVILESRPGEADGIAGRWGRKWGKGGLWGMVLHVPGEPGFPRCYGELSRDPVWGKEEREEFDRSLAQTLQKVSREAKWVADERQRVEMAARVMAGSLGYLGVVMARIDQRNAQARGKPKNEEGQLREQSEGLGLWWQMGLSFFALLVLVLMFLVFGGSSEEPPDDFLFPETEYGRRFRAPWSGGGNVLVEFRRPPGETRDR